MNRTLIYPVGSNGCKWHLIPFLCSFRELWSLCITENSDLPICWDEDNWEMKNFWKRLKSRKSKHQGLSQDPGRGSAQPHAHTREAIGLCTEVTADTSGDLQPRLKHLFGLTEAANVGSATGSTRWANRAGTGEPEAGDADGPGHVWPECLSPSAHADPQNQQLCLRKVTAWLRQGSAESTTGREMHVGLFLTNSRTLINLNI